MIIEVQGKRLAMELTTAQAKELIQKLTASLDHSNKTGSAWFATPTTVTDGTTQVSSRITFRIEG